MSAISVGDLAGLFQSRISHGRIKADIERLGAELTTGVAQNLREATGGDLGALAGLEHGIAALGAYRIAASEAALTAGTLQKALEGVQDTTSELAPSLLLASAAGQEALVQVTAADARSRFAAVVSMLNTQVAGRALLGGQATGGPPLADAETMLAGLGAAVAAETTAAGIEAAVETWFDAAGGGFETTGYLGAAAPLAPVRIGPNETAELSLKADDPQLRDLLKSYAMAALVAGGALSGNVGERAALLDLAGQRMMTAENALSGLRAGVGMAEAQIDSAIARNSAETAALEVARAELISVDPYTAASDLSAAQTRLETLYALTARLSRLSLAEYLR